MRTCSYYIETEGDFRFYNPPPPPWGVIEEITVPYLYKLRHVLKDF